MAEQITQNQVVTAVTLITANASKRLTEQGNTPFTSDEETLATLIDNVKTYAAQVQASNVAQSTQALLDIAAVAVIALAGLVATSSVEETEVVDIAEMARRKMIGRIQSSKHNIS